MTLTTNIYHVSNIYALLVKIVLWCNAWQKGAIITFPRVPKISLENEKGKLKGGPTSRIPSFKNKPPYIKVLELLLFKAKRPHGLFKKKHTVSKCWVREMLERLRLVTLISFPKTEMSKP